MRIWSLHPQYLDPQGLVALWREGLLAKKVLENKTVGYRNHLQLERFKDEKSGPSLLNLYLHQVCDEADRRGYKFNRSKLYARKESTKKIAVTDGQISYEWQHLSKKLFKRSRKVYLKNKITKEIELNPIFKVYDGPVEPWEII